MFNSNVIILFSVALALVLFIVYLILRAERRANKIYKVVHSNKKTTLLEEQTVEQKHILVSTSNFAGEPIRPGDMVRQAQWSQTADALKVNFLPLVKKSTEEKILKQKGIIID